MRTRNGFKRLYKSGKLWVAAGMIGGGVALAPETVHAAESTASDAAGNQHIVVDNTAQADKPTSGASVEEPLQAPETQATPQDTTLLLHVVDTSGNLVRADIATTSSKWVNDKATFSIKGYTIDKIGDPVNGIVTITVSPIAAAPAASASRPQIAVATPQLVQSPVATGATPAAAAVDTPVTKTVTVHTNKGDQQVEITGKIGDKIDVSLSLPDGYTLPYENRVIATINADGTISLSSGESDANKVLFQKESATVTYVYEDGSVAKTVTFNALDIGLKTDADGVSRGEVNLFQTGLLTSINRYAMNYFTVPVYNGTILDSGLTIPLLNRTATGTQKIVDKDKGALLHTIVNTVQSTNGQVRFKISLDGQDKLDHTFDLRAAIEELNEQDDQYAALEHFLASDYRNTLAKLYADMQAALPGTKILMTPVTESLLNPSTVDHSQDSKRLDGILDNYKVTSTPAKLGEGLSVTDFDNQAMSPTYLNTILTLNSGLNTDFNAWLSTFSAHSQEILRLINTPGAATESFEQTLYAQTVPDDFFTTNASKVILHISQDGKVKKVELPLDSFAFKASSIAGNLLYSLLVDNGANFSTFADATSVVTPTLPTNATPEQQKAYEDITAILKSLTASISKLKPSTFDPNASAANVVKGIVDDPFALKNITQVDVTSKNADGSTKTQPIYAPDAPDAYTPDVIAELVAKAKQDKDLSDADLLAQGVSADMIPFIRAVAATSSDDEAAVLSLLGDIINTPSAPANDTVDVYVTLPNNVFDDTVAVETSLPAGNAAATQRIPVKADWNTTIDVTSEFAKVPGYTLQDKVFAHVDSTGQLSFSQGVDEASAVSTTRVVYTANEVSTTASVPTNKGAQTVQVNGTTGQTIDVTKQIKSPAGYSTLDIVKATIQPDGSAKIMITDDTGKVIDELIFTPNSVTTPVTVPTSTGDQTVSVTGKTDEAVDITGQIKVPSGYTNEDTVKATIQSDGSAKLTITDKDGQIVDKVTFAPKNVTKDVSIATSDGAQVFQVAGKTGDILDVTGRLKAPTDTSTTDHVTATINPDGSIMIIITDKDGIQVPLVTFTGEEVEVPTNAPYLDMITGNVTVHSNLGDKLITNVTLTDGKPIEVDAPVVQGYTATGKITVSLNPDNILSGTPIVYTPNSVAKEVSVPTNDGIQIIHVSGKTGDVLDVTSQLKAPADTSTTDTVTATINPDGSITIVIIDQNNKEVSEVTFVGEKTEILTNAPHLDTVTGDVTVHSNLGDKRITNVTITDGKSIEVDAPVVQGYTATGKVMISVNSDATLSGTAIVYTPNTVTKDVSVPTNDGAQSVHVSGKTGDVIDVTNQLKAPADTSTTDTVKATINTDGSITIVITDKSGKEVSSVTFSGEKTEVPTNAPHLDTITGNVTVHSNLGDKVITNITVTDGKPVDVKVPVVDGYTADRTTVHVTINADGVLVTNDTVTYAKNGAVPVPEQPTSPSVKPTEPVVKPGQPTMHVNSVEKVLPHVTVAKNVPVTPTMPSAVPSRTGKTLPQTGEKNATDLVAFALGLGLMGLMGGLRILGKLKRSND